VQNPAKEIYLIRHGETEFNRKSIIQGRGVNSSINEKGLEQAKAFYEAYKHVEFDHILTSNLLRTQQTVQPFVDAGYSFTAFEQLDEINWGTHEGQTPSSSLSEEYKTLLDSWRAGNLDVSIPQGESPLELQLRQKDFIVNILPNYHGRILICTHGRAMRSLLCTMLDVPLSTMDDFPHNNLSLYLLHADDQGLFDMVKFNSTDHLKNI
jgi:probable phosphoglycerate mutase